MAELEFQALSVSMRGRRVLHAVTLRVERGDFVALLGPNGAGKTTLLKAALALRAPSSGQVLVRGQPAASLGARARAEAIAWLPQQSRADEPVSALDAVAAARYRFREAHVESMRAAERALIRVGAGAYLDRALTELSGGERQRVAFARLLAQEARMLFFDEPANHLDPAQQFEVYRLLGELWREGRTIVCINHDVNLLAHLGRPGQLRVVALCTAELAFEVALSDETLPARLGALFGVPMTALENDGARFIVPRLGDRG